MDLHEPMPLASLHHTIGSANPIVHNYAFIHTSHVEVVNSSVYQPQINLLLPAITNVRFPIRRPADLN